MKLIRSMRLLLLAALLSIVPASSFAGVFISIGIAPPPLVVYEQPICPQEGYLRTPGYWAYGEEAITGFRALGCLRRSQATSGRRPIGDLKAATTCSMTDTGVRT